jgi:2-polyprenyl-3-methyl-5-hydroxy-6-metoxy-1,4-benzoquinol methylase
MTVAREESRRDGVARVTACPVCGTRERTVLHDELSDRMYAAPGTWSLSSCSGCGAAYLDPRPTDEALAAAYRDYYTHTRDIATHPITRAETARRAIRNGYLNSRYGYRLSPASALGPVLMRLFPFRREAAGRWIRHLERPLGRPRLLDVGCGNGAFLAHMSAAGWDVYGIEPDATAAGVAQALGVPVARTLLRGAPFPDGHFDAVTMMHVIEHMPDPVDSLRIARRLLRPGGVLSITTPNLASRGHAMFGRDWVGLDAPRHLVLFTPDSLEVALERAGFEVESRPTSCMAQWCFAASAAITQGADPSGPPPLRGRLLWRARLADWRALRHRDRAEEIVVLARKPARAIRPGTRARGRMPSSRSGAGRAG